MQNAKSKSWLSRVMQKFYGRDIKENEALFYAEDSLDQKISSLNTEISDLLNDKKQKITSRMDEKKVGNYYLHNLQPVIINALMHHDLLAEDMLQATVSVQKTVISANKAPIFMVSAQQGTDTLFDVMLSPKHDDQYLVSFALKSALYLRETA